MGVARGSAKIEFGGVKGRILSMKIGDVAILPAGQVFQDRPTSPQEECPMHEDLTTWLGALAAACSSLSYLPQVQKAWPRGSTADLSWKMLAALTSGLLLWVLYGALRGDLVILGANLVGASLSGLVLGFKLRDIRGA